MQLSIIWKTVKMNTIEPSYQPYPTQSNSCIHIILILLNLLPEPHSLIILCWVDILRSAYLVSQNTVMMFLP